LLTIFNLVTEHSVVASCNYRIINTTSVQRPDKLLGFQYADLISSGMEMPPFSPRRVVGIVAGFSGGKNYGLKDIMLKVLVGAVTGLALGAAPGALSGVVTPRQSLGSALQKAVHPDSASPDAKVPGMTSSAELTGPPAPVTSRPADSLGQTGTVRLHQVRPLIIGLCSYAEMRIRRG
jgi:hypothetical protein